MFEQLLKQNPTAKPKRVVVSQRKVEVPKVFNPWGLSAMEFEIMRLLHDYVWQAEIGRLLNVSKKSVNTYTLRARTKMGTKTMTEALQLFRGFMQEEK
jgi:DNA-binding CsgD family transcriptional regulator